MSRAFPFQKPLILGHRGACAHAPENTLAAFRLALESGADGIELDARLAQDGAVMVLHDAVVDRVTNGQGWLADMTQAEAASLDAGSRFEPRFAGECIPSLQQVFETFGARPIYDLEIKNFEAPFNGLEARVLDLVRRFRLEERVIVTSFNPLAVRFFQKKLPLMAAGLLLLSGKLGALQESLVSRWLSPSLVGVSAPMFSADFVSRQRGRATLVWGAATPDEVHGVMDGGAAVVVVDDPGMARRALEGR